MSHDQGSSAHRAGDLLRQARLHERAGRMAEAVQGYDEAISASQQGAEPAILAEALRRLAVVHYYRNQPELASELCQRSYQTAVEIGQPVLAAEALNALAGFDFESGSIAAAREKFFQASRLGNASPELRGRTEQNLGILANLQGFLSEATTHYQESLLAFESCGDVRGCAIGYHNLGMVSADRELWDEAETHFRRCLELAESVGDIHLQGLGLLNYAEVHLARQLYDQAQESAEAALRIFEQIGSQLDTADAHRMIGRICRETGRQDLAESRLSAALALAVDTRSVLTEAEASRELALLYHEMGRHEEALRLFSAARKLFSHLDARIDLADVSARIRRIEENCSE